MAQQNLDWTYSSTVASEFPQAGTKACHEDGRTMICVYNAGADAIAAGNVVGVFVTTPAAGHVSVTAATMLDITDGTTTRSAAAGVAVGAIAAGAYGWLWCGGFSEDTITTDGNVAAGHGLVLADGAKVASPASTAASAHVGVFGYAAEDDSSTSLTGASLMGTYWG